MIPLGVPKLWSPVLQILLTEMVLRDKPDNQLVWDALPNNWHHYLLYVFLSSFVAFPLCVRLDNKVVLFVAQDA